jgi:hypothetical protein
MTMSEITNKLKYDISDALKRAAGKLSLRKEGQGCPAFYGEQSLQVEEVSRFGGALKRAPHLVVERRGSHPGFLPRIASTGVQDVSSSQTWSVAASLLAPEFSGQAVGAGFSLGRLNQGLELRPFGDLTHDLRPDGFGKLGLLSHRDHEAPWSSNHAVPEVEIKAVDVPQAVRPLQHDRQPVDGDALRHGLVPGCGHDAALVVGPVPGDVDHLGSVALTGRGTIGSVLSDRDRHSILWLDRIMQQSRLATVMNWTST